MAEDFRALIEAQKETTRLLMTAEQQAEMDAAIAESQHKDKIKSDIRIEAGRKAWQTRQDNKKLSAGGAAAKEDAQEKASAEKKNQNLLKKIAGGVTGMFGKMNEKIKGVGKGFMAMLKTTLLAGFMIALLAFLQSDEWKKMKVWIVEKLVPKLKDFWTKTLKPFIDNLLIFIKDPSWDTFGNIFGGVENKSSLAFAVAGLAFLFRPIRTTMLAGGLLFKGMKGLAGMFGKEGFLNKGIKNLLGFKPKVKPAIPGMPGGPGGPPEGTKKIGKLKQIASKASKSIGDGLRSVWGKSVSIVQKAGTGIASIASRASGAISGALGSIWSGGKAGAAKVGGKALSAGKGLLRLMGGAARFAGPIGLAVTAGIGIIGGVTAGIEAYKDTPEGQSKIANAVKHGAAGALEALTFGLISKDTFVKAFEGIGESFNKLADWIYTPGSWSPGGTTSAKLFGVSLGFPDIGSMLEAGWDELGKSFTKFVNWIYTPGQGSPGGTTSAKLFGVSLGFPDIGSMLKAGWDKLGTFFTGIANWIYTPGTAATMGGGGTSAKLFGIELKFPDFDISLPTKEELVAMLPAWIRDFEFPEFPEMPKWMKDFKFPEFPDFELPKLENLTMPDFNLKEDWDKFTSSIPQWIKNNIFDPGAAGRGGSGAGSPMKIFGMELSFPSLNISFSGMADKIKSLLPEWLTNPVGFIKGLVAKMAKQLSWIPGMGSDDDAPMDPKLKADALAVLDAREKTLKKGIAKQQKLIDKMLKKRPDRDVSNYQMGIDARKAKLADIAAQRIEIEKRKMGGPVRKGVPYLVHGTPKKPELFVPSSSGMILSAQKTEKIMQAGLQRGTPAAGAAGPAIVNAPVNTVNNSQTNTTVSSTELKHPSAILASVNIAA